MTTDKEIRKFVTDRFIAEGKDSTVKEIAAGLSVSEASVRKVINDNAFNRDGWATHYEDYRESTSRNYPGMSCGGHKVTVYGPSRSYMAKMIRADEMDNAMPREIDGCIPGY